MFGKNYFDINAGIGIGKRINNDPSFETKISKNGISFDYGIIDDIVPGVIGIGAAYGFSSFEQIVNSSRDPYGYKYETHIFGIRGTYFHKKKIIYNMDTYFVSMIHYVKYNKTEVGHLPINTNLKEINDTMEFSILIGARFFFQQDLAVFTELGYGITYLNLGLTYRINN
jgi:hypothetical protein